MPIPALEPPSFAGLFAATIGTTFAAAELLGVALLGAALLGAALLGAAWLSGEDELGGPALALPGRGVAVLEGGPETGNGVDAGPLTVGTLLDGSGVLMGERTEGGGGVFECRSAISFKDGRIEAGR